MFNLSSISIIGAVVAAAVVYHFTTNQIAKVEGRSEGRQQERASVEKQATKKDAQAQTNRRAAAASDAIRMLDNRGELRPEPKP